MMAQRGGYGFGMRFARLLHRRPRLFSFVVAIVVARVILSLMEVGETKLDVLSLVITVALVVEVAVVWRRIAPHRGQEHQARAGSEGSALERFLTVTERVGAPVIYGSTAILVVVEVVLAVRGTSLHLLAEVTNAVRWAELAILLVVVFAARAWDQRYPALAAPPPVGSEWAEPEGVGGPVGPIQSGDAAEPPWPPPSGMPSPPPPPWHAGGSEPPDG